MADTSFFGRLTKLFRTQAVVTVDKEGKRKVIDTDERQQTNLSSLRDSTRNYKKVSMNKQVVLNQWHTNKFVEKFLEILMQWIMTQY